MGFDGVGEEKGILVDLKYQSPELHEIYIDSQKVEYELETFENGAHAWVDSERKLTVYIRGSTKVTIITTNYVQVLILHKDEYNVICDLKVSMTLAMTVDEFYDGGGLDVFVRNVAYSLGIDMARIRVVNVSSGRRKHRKLLDDSQIDINVLIVEDVTSEMSTSTSKMTTQGNKLLN